VNGLLAAVQASLEDLKALKGTVLVTGGSLSLESQGSVDAALYMKATTLACAKAAQRKLVHILHNGLKAEGIYVCEVTVSNVVRGTAYDPEGKSSLTAEAVANTFWELYSTRNFNVWHVIKA